MGLLSFLFGTNKVKEALKQGAIVIDVRTPHEFDQGKVPGSINIPFDRIASSAQRIKTMQRPIIFCSSSGTSSAKAVRIMKEKGLKDVFNGGGWEDVLSIYQKL